MNIPFAASLLAFLARRQAARQARETVDQLDLSQVQRVLLVVTTGIGDAIFSSAVFPSVRAALPQADIRLFCRAGWQELFSGDANLNGVIPYAGKFRKLATTLKHLRAFKPDLTLVLHGNDPDIIPLCILAGSRFTVRVPTLGTAFTQLLANRNRPQDEQTVPGLHYVDNRVRVLDSVGMPILSRVPVMAVNPATQARVDGVLQAALPGMPFWVLHVHAANPYKSLPPNTARQLLEAALARFPGHGVVLSGGPENAEALGSLIPPGAESRVLVSAGRFSLAESAACLARASAVVAPDTGILHLAAALDRPVIGLFSPTLPALVGPRAVSAPVVCLSKPQTCDPCLQKKCPHLPVLCMAQFQADEILAPLAEMIAP